VTSHVSHCGRERTGGRHGKKKEKGSTGKNHCSIRYATRRGERRRKKKIGSVKTKKRSTDGSMSSGTP